MAKRRITTVVSAVAVALGVSVLSAAPAFAIDRTNCTGQNDVILASDKTTCWANRGSINVNLYYVTMISTPAFDVDLTFSNGRTVYYPRNGAWRSTAGDHVTRINIR